MRILVVSNLYPPVVRGGYEVECSGVVERLRERHEVLVLTSDVERGDRPAADGVQRRLALLEQDAGGALRAPMASLRAARIMRETLATFRPDMAFVWNGAQIPQAALCVLADSATPVSYRVCELWFGRLFTHDQYLRHVLPGDRGPRRVWAALLRALNHHPALRLDPARRTPAAISWNSETTRRLSGVPPSVEPVLERVIHSTSTRVPRFAEIERKPDPQPTIVFMGRLVAGKGAWVAVRALGRLRRDHGIDARLVLAGAALPAERTAIEREIAGAGVGDRVELTGPLDTEQVAALLARAHALVVPSTVQDAFPLVCVEAAVARVPVVASDIGGIPECLHHVEHALLFPAGDDASCAAALARTLTETEDTAKRVESARLRGEEFRWEPYLDASERFVDDAAAALGVPGAEAAST